MERKNTDRNISPISVRICLNGYRLSFIRDSRHVNAYQYQKIPHSSKRLSLSLSLIYLSSFLHFFLERSKIRGNEKRNVSFEMIGFTTKILSYPSIYAHNSSNNQRSRGARRWKNGHRAQGMRERRGSIVIVA